MKEGSKCSTTGARVLAAAWEARNGVDRPTSKRCMQYFKCTFLLFVQEAADVQHHDAESVQIYKVHILNVTILFLIHRGSKTKARMSLRESNFRKGRKLLLYLSGHLNLAS